MSDSNINEVLTEAINPSDDGFDPENLSLEALILLINTERLKTISDKSEKEFKELKERQAKVAELHDIQKAINAATGENGELKCDEELKKLLDKARELGVDVPEGKDSFNRDERERLIENIRMTVEDLNVQNDMQLQTISRLTNERYESYQMARSIIKPLDDAKKAMAHGIK